MRQVWLLLLSIFCGCAFNPQRRPTSWDGISEENLVRYVRESPFIDVQKKAASQINTRQLLYMLVIDSSVNDEVRNQILTQPLGETYLMDILLSKVLDEAQQIIAIRQIKTKENLRRLLVSPITYSAKESILSRPLSEGFSLELLMADCLDVGLQKLVLRRVRSEDGLRVIVRAPHLHIETRKKALVALPNGAIEMIFDTWKGDLAMFCLLFPRLPRSKQETSAAQLKLLRYWGDASVTVRREMLKWFRDDTELLDGRDEQMEVAEVIMCYDSPKLRKQLETILIDDYALVYLAQKADIDLSKWAISRIQNTENLKLLVKTSRNPVIQSYIISLYPDEDSTWFKSLLNHQNEFVRKAAYERIKANEAKFVNEDDVFL